MSDAIFSIGDTVANGYGKFAVVERVDRDDWSDIGYAYLGRYINRQTGEKFRTVVQIDHRYWDKVSIAPGSLDVVYCHKCDEMNLTGLVCIECECATCAECNAHEHAAVGWYKRPICVDCFEAIKNGELR